MKYMIIANMLWNGMFIMMAASEMIGFTDVHGSLPWWFKWWWICALAGGNLFIHVIQLLMLRSRF